MDPALLKYFHSSNQCVYKYCSYDYLRTNPAAFRPLTNEEYLQDTIWAKKYIENLHTKPIEYLKELYPFLTYELNFLSKRGVINLQINFFYAVPVYIRNLVSFVQHNDISQLRKNNIIVSRWYSIWECCSLNDPLLDSCQTGRQCDRYYKRKYRTSTIPPKHYPYYYYERVAQYGTYDKLIKVTNNFTRTTLPRILYNKNLTFKQKLHLLQNGTGSP